MNIFNLVNESQDGFMLPGYESNHPPYIVDMTISSDSNINIMSLGQMLVSPIFETLVKDTRFNIYDKYCYVVIYPCVPHLIVAHLLQVLLSQFGIFPLVYVFDKLHGLMLLGDIIGFKKYKESYDDFHNKDWLRLSNAKKENIK